MKAALGGIGLWVLLCGAAALPLSACGGDDSGGGSGAMGGTAGNGGVGGTGGFGGSSGASVGNGGTGGTGADAACSSAADCEAGLPETDPAGCAEAVCDTVVGRCVYRAKDADGDGHGDARCSVVGEGSLQAGDDCDDSDDTVFPGSWDGPEQLGDATKPNRCDSVDQDCNGNADDKKVGGISCSCDPDDPPSCAESEQGAPLTGLDGTTAGVGTCVLGARQCENGALGKCIGAVGPRTETCNGVDDDCNGVVDDNATGAATWYLDQDGDNYGDASTTPVTACAAPGAAWKQNIPNTDCNDADSTTSPAGHDAPACDGIDHDCNGTAGTGCGCVTGQTQTCYSGQSNVCNQAVITCAAGTWPTCPSPIYKEQYCQDSDGDTYCSSTCQLACSAPAVGWRKNCATGLDCDDTKAFAHPGAAETCGDNVNANCDITGADSDGFNLGACSKGVGACYRTGTQACTSLTSSACNAQTVNPDNSWHSSRESNTDSWDWNCDGVVEQRFTNVYSQCNGLTAAACGGAYQGSGNCGDGLSQCKWNSSGGSCQSSGGTTNSQQCR